MEMGALCPCIPSVLHVAPHAPPPTHSHCVPVSPSHCKHHHHSAAPPPPTPSRRYNSRHLGGQLWPQSSAPRQVERGLCISNTMAKPTGPTVQLHNGLVTTRDSTIIAPRAASGCRFLTAAAACVPYGVVSAVGGPSRWRTGGCWLLRGSFYGFGCPLFSAFRSSTTYLAVFPCVRGLIAPPLRVLTCLTTLPFAICHLTPAPPPRPEGKIPSATAPSGTFQRPLVVVHNMHIRMHASAMHVLSLMMRTPRVRHTVHVTHVAMHAVRRPYRYDETHIGCSAPGAQDALLDAHHVPHVRSW